MIWSGKLRELVSSFGVHVGRLIGVICGVDVRVLKYEQSSARRFSSLVNACGIEVWTCGVCACSNVKSRVCVAEQICV